MDFHGTKCILYLIYVVIDLRAAILSFFCISTFFMLKNIKIQKNGKNYCKKSHENPSCGLAEKLQETFFLENGITEDKMSLRTAILAHFI